jgi:glycosyltransferase involved in cell wall biosynthesis
MRIAIVTDWFAPRLGGIESQLVELATRLSGAGHEVRVITATPGDAADFAFDIVRLDVLRLPSPPLAISPSVLSGLRRELSHGWDVVHAHISVVSPVGWGGALVARSMGLPVSVTFHSVLRAKAALLRMLSATTGLATARVAWSAVSGFVAAQASDGLNGAEVRVLANGIDLERWKQTRRTRNGGDVLTILSAMRLHRKKRAHALIRCFAAAVRDLPVRARLVIIGDGPDRGRLESLIDRLRLRTGLATVEISGWLEPRDISRRYAEADAFALASVHEAFGLAALEARAAGLPVLARRAGHSEFLLHDHNALLCDSDEELARAISRFLGDRGLRARLDAARDDHARFSWPAVLRAHIAEYDRARRLAGLAAPAAALSAAHIP